ncbi:MAG: peptide chain release factor 1, partial [Chlamydiia bacterium]|nr:peptide chain release factor 1 [Chlamydiia bacterium]
EEMREIAESEREELEEQIEVLEKKLKELLIPPDPNDHASTILEIRAGTGGDEAALFVGDVVRMYKLYADANRWKYELLASSPSELGGFREYIMVISGKNVHRFLQFEGGTHRVQRVPDTETQGRVHTSAITIAVLIEPPESEEVPIDEKDLRIDTYRSSGAGGQHVNTTDSAVRITHVPTGTVVYCQEERSQIKNRAKAMRLLRAKLVEIEERKHMESMASKRQSQVGSGDRSERIRTYNFPQNRVTDHRINLTLYSLDRVMEGELIPFSTALLEKHYESQIDAAQNQPSL